MTSGSIKILHTPAEAKAWRAGLDPRARVGFVPTMGALHRGHGELLRRLRPRCDVSVLSIFVNPAQFAPTEDLARYPRTFERDLELAKAEGVNVVFAPVPDAMYPPGFSTWVEETQLTQSLCGAHRPGHFRGVTTVVLKLFNLVRPELALFGLKDAQQFFVLHRMARDLDLDVSVEGVPTVREEDGLALSSRNAYLSAEERRTAPFFYRALRETTEALGRLPRDAAPQALASTLESARRALAANGFRPQYLELRSLSDFSELTRAPGEEPALLAGAVYLGNTRLIDNIILNPERLSQLGVRLA